MKLTKRQEVLLTRLDEGWELVWSYSEQSYMLEKDGKKHYADERTVRNLKVKGLLLNFAITPMGKIEAEIAETKAKEKWEAEQLALLEEEELTDFDR